MKRFLLLLIPGILLLACNEKTKSTVTKAKKTPAKTVTVKQPTDIQAKLSKYATFRLTTDLSKLAPHEKKMIPLFVEAAKIMNELFWYQAYGDKEALLKSIPDEPIRRFAMMNYGPWDRLDGNKSFVPVIGKKPLGANFYPLDMTKAEFEKWGNKSKSSLYTFVERAKNGNLMTVPFHRKFKVQLKKAADLLLQAEKLAKDKGLKNYLKLRAKALLTDNFRPSDLAWLDMKTNHLDIVIGPIETYEDQLFGYKASYEGYVLVKDMEWSKRLAKYAKYLPELQEGLPVPAKYKTEKPGRDTELNAYDVVYYAGDCNAGSKTIAINLPNDEVVQLKKGTRRLQLKNAMKAKFDKILTAIADELIDDSQRKHITFDAFFANTMFHEVSHGLGIKKTVNGRGMVRKALKEHSSALEEGKADLLGLYMIRQLHKKGEIKGDLKDNYVTFLASIFRSIRFGSSSAHGKANLIRFNFFKEMGAFEKNPETGKYKINFPKFESAMDALSKKILLLQGNGDYVGVAKLVKEKAVIGTELKADLAKLNAKGIPVDIVFTQGVTAMGL